MAIEETGEATTETTTEPAAEGGDGPARAEDGTFVSAERLKVEPPTRRSRAKEQLQSDIDARFKEYETRWNSERSTLQQQLEQERQERQRIANDQARLQGAYEELRSRPAAAAAPVQQGPDPEELHRQATKELQGGNLDEYHRLERQAARIEARREAEGLIKPQFDAFKSEIEKRIPQQVPWEIQTLINTHPNVARRGQMGMQAVLAEAQRLAIYRTDIPADQRMAHAFGLAEKAFAGTQPAGNGRPAGFDPSSAAALSGLPTGNRAPANGAAAAGGVTLTGAALEAQRRSGMSPEEYVRWQNPEKYGLLT